MTTTGAEQQANAATLLPCPFCGEHLVDIADRDGKFMGHRRLEKRQDGSVVSSLCPASFAEVRNDEDVAHWNRRVSPWRPRSEAPTDGTPFLAWMTAYRCAATLWRSENKRWPWAGIAGVFTDDEFDFWMPALEPPEVEK